MTMMVTTSDRYDEDDDRVMAMTTGMAMVLTMMTMMTTNMVVDNDCRDDMTYDDEF